MINCAFADFNPRMPSSQVSLRDRLETLQAAKPNITTKRSAPTSISSSLFSLASPSGQLMATYHPNNPILHSLAN